jgi:hypothetical protein
MRAIDIAREAFAGLAAANLANPANPRTIASDAGLRTGCESCESDPPPEASPDEIRRVRSAFAWPQTRANACDSQDSQHSQGGAVELHSRTRRDAVLARLLRWGWPRDEAETTAARIARRATDDDRRTCPECAHAAPGRCRNHKRADLRSREIGRDLATLPQRCPGFAEVLT